MILRIVLIGLIIAYFIMLSGGQTCLNSPDVNQKGQVSVVRGRQVIVPNARFNCNGRITGISVSMRKWRGTDYPLFQVWHPTLLNSSTYNKTGEVKLPEGEFQTIGNGKNYIYATLPLNSSNQIEFQSGDVIGYYQPIYPRVLIWSSQTREYISYTSSVKIPLTSIDLNNVDSIQTDYQPLIKVMFDIQCDNLSTPANGNASCSSGRVGVGYKGDTCIFTCNTGYELTGSNTRTCQSDGSWSGNDTMCSRVSCSSLTDPNNGMVNCSLGDDGILSYEDTCSFTCNTGYELTASDTRTCQSNGSWSGADNVCRKVQCYDLVNVILQCPNGATTGVFEDTCTFSCNAGYELQGSNNGTCLANGSWSGGDPICVALNCSTSPPLNNSQLQSSCDTQYQSTCTTNCTDGYTGVGGSYSCVVTDEDTNSVGWNGSTSCQRVQCTSLSSPTNGNISCNSTGVSLYEDQCSFSCDPGYEPTESSSRQCLSTGSWSGSDVTCDIFHCDNLTDGIEYSVLANDCGSEFGSVCRVECNFGYKTVGNNIFTCISVNDTVEWRNNVNGGTFQCDIVTCENLETPSNGNINCSSNNQPLQYQDSCTFQCNDGYEVQGSAMRQCEASGEWSGSRTQCNIHHCPNITTLVPNSRSCDTTYTSTCMVECEDGYNRSGDSSQYSCGLNGTEVVWMFSGSEVTCSPVSCASLSDPENGNVTCPSNTSVFQDTCTYYCNRGYQLEGNRQTRCSADGTWSSEPVTCTILKCNDPEVEIANSQSVGACNVTYGSSCSLNCSSGYSVSGNGEHVCDDVNDKGTSVKWRSVGRAFSCAPGTSTESNSGKDSVILIITGSVGGVALFIIVSLLCVIILCARQYHYVNRSPTHDNSTEIEMTSDAKMNTSPSYGYGIPKQMQNRKQDQYDYVLHKNISGQDNTQDIIKMDSNPSYGSTQNSNTVIYDTTEPAVNDVAIQPNPSYSSVCKEAATIYDKDVYVEANSCSTQRADYHNLTGSATKEKESMYDVATDDTDNVKITPNPSYDAVSGGIKLEENPSYNKIILSQHA